MNNDSECCFGLLMIFYKTWTCITCRAKRSKGISIVSNFETDTKENNKKRFVGVVSRHPDFNYREYGYNNV